jgi:trigger factor
LVQVTVEDVGPCKKHLKITVPLAEVQAKIDENYAQLGSTATVSGFRKGHVPRPLLERRFGEEVLEDVKQAILSDASRKAVEEQGLKPIGEPSYDNVEFDPAKDCVFEITVEIEPRFDLPEYKGLKLKKPSAAVNEPEIDRGLEALRMQRARLDLMPEGTAVAGEDVIVCDWKAVSDGETVADQADAQVLVRGRRSGGVELEKDLAEVLDGAKFGETRQAAGKFTEDYPIEKWRGKEGQVEFTVKEVRRPKAPEIDEAFAKSLDFESLDELRAAVGRNLTQTKARDAQLALEEKLFDALLGGTQVELPEGVLKAQARNIMMRQQYRLRQRGIPDDEIEKHLEDLRNASESAAERNLKIFFVLNAIAEKEKIFVTENEVESRIASMASGYNTTPQRLRAQIEKDGSMSELRSGLRETKVVDFLLSKAEIEEEAS